MPKATALFNTNWRPHQVSSQVKWVELKGEAEEIGIVVRALLNYFYLSFWELDPHEGTSFEQYVHFDANLGDYILASIHIEKEAEAT